MKEIRYISPVDDAIDIKRSKLKGAQGYEGTLDHKHLVFLPGKKAVVFILRTLDQYGRDWVLGAAPGSYEQKRRACEVGLIGIEGYEPWGAGKVWEGTARYDLPNGKRTGLTRDEVAQVEEEFGHGILGEFMMVLLHEVDRGKAWGRSARPYTLPQSVWDDLVELALLRAE